MEGEIKKTLYVCLDAEEATVPDDKLTDCKVFLKDCMDAVAAGEPEIWTSQTAVLCDAWDLIDSGYEVHVRKGGKDFNVKEGATLLDERPLRRAARVQHLALSGALL